MAGRASFATSTETPNALFTTMVGLARYYALAGDLATAVELAEQLVDNRPGGRKYRLARGGLSRERRVHFWPG